MPENTPELLRYELFHFQGRHGIRIFEDGRYESYQAVGSSAELTWKASTPFTPEQISELTAKIDEIIKSDALNRSKSTELIVPDTAYADFTLRDKRCHIDNYPDAAPAELKQLMDRIAEIHKRES